MVRTGRIGQAQSKSAFERLKSEHFGKLNFASDSPERILRELLDAEIQSVGGKASFQHDIELGIALHKVFEREGVGDRVLSDAGFWFWLALEVIPDLCFERWGALAYRFFDRERCWPRQCWWFLELSRTGSLLDPDVEKRTRAVLKPRAQNDVYALVERPGRGFRVSFTRELMLQASKVPELKGKSFPRLMKFVVAATACREPAMHPRGEKGMVAEIFAQLRVT
jgi:hypothetical protein